MREDKNENRWDKLLQIHTMGRDDSRSDLYRYPYEPTPYCVLERMANTGMIRKGKKDKTPHTGKVAGDPRR